jgi:hypothetical protein
MALSIKEMIEGEEESDDNNEDDNEEEEEGEEEGEEEEEEDDEEGSVSVLSCSRFRLSFSPREKISENRWL